MIKKFLPISLGIISLSVGFSPVVFSHNVCEKESKSLDNLVIVVDPKPTQRAFNFARMRAETLNGGIGKYQAQSCMYSHDSSKLCLIDESNGYTYRFFGGAPGWEVLKQPPSKETVIRIFIDGKIQSEVIYNGSPR